MAKPCRSSAHRWLLGIAGLIVAWSSGASAAPLPVVSAPGSSLVVVAQILSDRPISEGLRRPSIGGERLPDMLQRPDTRTDIRPRRRIIMPQQEICRDEPAFRRTDKGTARGMVRRCYVVPSR